MSWNGSTNNGGVASAPKKSAKKSFGVVRYFIAAGMIVLGVIILLYLVNHENGEPKDTMVKNAVVKEVAPDIASRVKNVHTNVQEEVSEAPGSVDEKKDPPVVVSKPTGPQGRVMRLMDGTIVTNRTPVIFEREFEKGLMVALRPNGISGTLLAEIRAENSDEQILAMLKELTLPSDDDPPGVARIKNEVQALKEQMLLEIQNGRTVAEVFAQIQSVKSLDHMVNVKTMRMQMDAIDGGDAEEVRLATKKINEMRMRRGLDPLEVPEEFRGSEDDQFDDQNQIQTIQEEDYQ